MSRKAIPPDLSYPIHVTARSNSKIAFPLPKEEVWSIFEDYLYLMKVGFDLKIHSFVLMDNHFHWIVSAPKGNLSQALAYGLREVSREIGRLSKTRNHQFGGRSFKCAISSFHHYMHAYKYVYRNPVAAGLCATALDYRFSTLHGLLGRSPLMIPVEDDTLLFGDFEKTIAWLLRKPEDHNSKFVQTALKKSEFRLPKAISGYSNPLEIELL